MATLNNGGGFVATWRDNSFLRGDQTRSGSIIAQRFDNAGNKVGGEVLVDTRGINFVNDAQRHRAVERRLCGVWEARSNVGDIDDSSIECSSSTPPATRSARCWWPIRQADELPASPRW